MIKNLESSVPVPQTPGWDDVRALLVTMQDSVLAGKVGVRDALTQAAAQGQQALDKYR